MIEINREKGVALSLYRQNQYGYRVYYMEAVQDKTRHKPRSQLSLDDRYLYAIERLPNA